MELKEKCIYYDPSKNGYYLVLHISDMIYGRQGTVKNPSNLDIVMMQPGDIKFKIDDITINIV